MKLEQLIREAIFAMEEHGDMEVGIFEPPSRAITVKAVIVGVTPTHDGHNPEKFVAQKLFILLP